MSRLPLPGAVPFVDTIDHRSLMHMGPTPAPLRHPAWLLEVKFDGYRMLAFREGKRARLLSRNGRDSSLNFPEVLQAPIPLPIDCVLDCELTISDEHGGKPATSTS